MPIGHEARCGKCGETFTPMSQLEIDLVHIQREDGTECLGVGVLVGSWDFAAHCEGYL